MTFDITNDATAGGVVVAREIDIFGVPTSPPTEYAAWLDLYPTLTDPTVGGDPDGDGIENLLEYALDGDPTTQDQSILPALDASGANFIFSFTRRAESIADTTQVFQYGSSLTTWTNVSLTAPVGVEVTLGSISNGLQPVTVTIYKNAAVDQKIFGRLMVIAN